MKLHEHPQLDSYKADGSDWPVVDLQGWFGDPNPLMASHVHIAPKSPVHAEITDLNLKVPFTLKAHMFDGVIMGLSGPQIKSIKWDETGSEQVPVMKADPNGLKEWTGVAFFDFSLNPPTFPEGLFKFPTHGWGELRFLTITQLANGDRVDFIGTPTVYSMLDPTAPIHKPAEQGNPGVFVRSSLTVWRPNVGAIVGEVVSELNDYFPLLAIDKPWTCIANAYNYTAPPDIEPKERLELRSDPDLHHGVLGSLQRAVDVGPGQNRSFLGPIVIDPTTMGTGPHKEMLVWTQPVKAEAFSAVVVVPILVGQGVPIPPKILIPNIVGKTQEQAVIDLVAAGLLLGSVMEMSDQTPKGNVISQFPLAGTLVVPKTTVNLMISSGAVITPTEIWVPTVPTFMQLHINGVPQKKWQICGVDNNMTMDDCVEIVVKDE